MTRSLPTDFPSNQVPFSRAGTARTPPSAAQPGCPENPPEPESTPSSPAPLLLDRLAERARSTPEAPVLEEVGPAIGDGPRSMTAGELWAAARSRSAAFSAFGVQPGDPVATLLGTSIEGVATWLGLGLLGAHEVPIGPDLDGQVLVETLRGFSARVLVTEPGRAQAVARLAAELPELVTVLVTGREAPGADTRVRALADLPSSPPDLEPELPGAGAVACGILTSGTTGPPKCLLAPWGQLRQMFTEALLLAPSSPHEAVYVFTPLNHLIARGLVYRALLYNTGRAVLRRRFSRTDWWADVHDRRCTEAILPAATAHWLLGAEPRPDDADNTLRRVIITPLVPQAREFEIRFGVPVSISFGATEFGIPIASHGLPPDLGSCGRQVPGVELRIVEPGTEVDVPEDGVGELLVRNSPDKVSVGRIGGVQAPRPDGWIATGDLFHRDPTGWYFFDGRLHDIIRRRGENISPLPIEDAAIRDPDVLLAVAVPVPSELGEDEIKLYVQPQPGADVTLPALVERLEAALPRFMVPRYLESRRELPLTPTGKIRRTDLRREDVLGPATLDREGGLRPPTGT